MKGSIQPNHIPLNKYTLLVVGMPQLTPTEISGITEELQTVDLPDRTRASGGNTTPGEFTMLIPMHHTLEVAAMEAWYREGRDPVLPTYKKPATLIMHRIGPGVPRAFQLLGAFVRQRALPDLEMANEGEMAAAEYTVSYDDVLP